MTAKRWTCVLAFLIAAGAATGPARAQTGDVDIEVPVLILDTGATTTEEGDDELDLANVVQSAAKGVTTVQEAPAIVTVITADDIAERGFTRLDDIIDTVPGWLRVDAIHSQFPFGLTRGTVQAMLYMHNGISMFDPWQNVPLMGRQMPIEIIKRVEMITGPGGVLWGANSFMGIVNVITKDAEDVDGVEARAFYGDGPGDRGMAGGYVMAGIPELFSDKGAAFLHVGFQNFEGPKFSMPQHLFSTSLPFPNSQMVYGPLTESTQRRSTLFTFDGKLSYGALNINFQYPIFHNYAPLAWPGQVTRDKLAEESKDIDGDGVLDCSFVEPWLPNGQPNPAAFAGDDRCVDRGRIGGTNRFDWVQRYVTADWRTRFADGKAGATVKAYAIQFHDDWQQLNILSPSILLEGGLSFRFDLPAYRVGAIYDGDWELPSNWRLLYGAEGFREWIPDTITESRQGAGTQANIIGPYDYGRTPLACPRQPNPDVPGTDQFVPACPLTFQFAAHRTVLGAYVNPQWRPSKKLILDGGVRLQAAPESLSNSSYPLQFIFSGAAVYELAKNWHAKLNYAEGFRPPVFINTHSNGESIQIDGSREMKVENSRSGQVEVNARLFKGSRRLREVNFRADYSYTKIDNLIGIVGGRYENTGDRGIHSAELLGKVFLKGGHRLELGYTWVKIATDDRGWFKAAPEHWFNLAGVFNLIGDHLQATTALRVLGAQEDPNRLVEYRNLPEVGPDTLVGEVAVNTQPYELVLDRLPPSATLTVGLTWLDAFGIDRLQGQLFAYNAFNGRYYQPDIFQSYEPRLEMLPNPWPDFRFVSSLTYSY